MTLLVPLEPILPLRGAVDNVIDPVRAVNRLVLNVA